MLAALAENKTTRIALAQSSLGWFCQIYLKHYITSATPPFHWELFDELQNEERSYLLLMAFRGSGKSTVAALAYPLWCAVTGRKKFILLAGDTHTQAKQHISNIIYELENNKILQDDWGPFKSDEEWTAINIVLKNGGRIMSRSRGQKTRGLRHLQYRPDLIICDDVENNEVVRTKEQRDKTEEWFLSEVIPAMDTIDGKLVLIGNLLHLDSLLARQRARITGSNIGIVHEYPLVNKITGASEWPAKYPQHALDKLKRQVGERFYLREYLLKVIPEEGQVVRQLHYYKGPLPSAPEAVAIGVDLAISQKQTADYSAINAMAKCDNGKFYNLSNEAGRWSFNDTLQQINLTYERYRALYPNISVLLGVENVGYQQSAIEEITRRYHLPVEEIKRTMDKRARLQVIEPYLTSGEVLLRQDEDADVANEILNFGIEQYDDRMDALEISINMLLNSGGPNVYILGA